MLEEEYKFVRNLPGLYLLKDRKSIYINISEQLAQFLGWKHSEDGVGKTDYDLPCEAENSANEFIKIDKKTIELGIELDTIDIGVYHSNWKILFFDTLRGSF